VTRNSGAAASLLRYSFVTVSTATPRVLWLSSNPFDQSQNDQQNNRADEGVDDRANGATADYNADPWQQPASDKTTDNPHNDVTDESVAATLNDHTSKPASYGADD
jgi:hypothetical protein